MQPNFQILADQKDITLQIRDRLLSLRITDETEIQSDTIEIQLDDRDNSIEWPRHGAELDLALGYKETGLTRLGVYIVDEVEHNGPPQTLTIRGKAADMRESLKEHKTRTWSNLTFRTLVETIAGEHNLTPRISDALAVIGRASIEQTEEADMHLLSRLAKEVGAIAKPMGGRLLFVKQGEAKTASGITLPTVEMTATDIISHRMTQADRGKYQAVRAYWYSTPLAERQPVQAGEGKPVFTIRHTYSEPQQATQAAISKLESLQRGTATLSLTLIGNAEMQAEGKVSVSGLRDTVNGEWLIKRVEHQFSGQGFTTNVEAEVPNE